MAKYSDKIKCIRIGTGDGYRFYRLDKPKEVVAALSYVHAFGDGLATDSLESFFSGDGGFFKVVSLTKKRIAELKKKMKPVK